jgi:hypothetical protein
MSATKKKKIFEVSKIRLKNKKGKLSNAIAGAVKKRCHVGNFKAQYVWHED